MPDLGRAAGDEWSDDDLTDAVPVDTAILRDLATFFESTDPDEAVRLRQLAQDAARFELDLEAGRRHLDSAINWLRRMGGDVHHRVRTLVEPSAALALREGEANLVELPEAVAARIGWETTVTWEVTGTTLTVIAVPNPEIEWHHPELVVALAFDANDAVLASAPFTAGRLSDVSSMTVPTTPAVARVSLLELRPD